MICVLTERNNCFIEFYKNVRFNTSYNYNQIQTHNQFSRLQNIALLFLFICKNMYMYLYVGTRVDTSSTMHTWMSEDNSGDVILSSTL